LDVIEINILTPYPGTPLFDRLEREGRLLNKDWSRYNQVDIVFKPKNMSEKELFEGTRRVAKEFYSWHNIIKRNVRIFSITKKLTALLPAGNNYTFRRYYKRDLNF
ncbi:MAG: DUF4070 domain-containing protein, partial [Thermoplasmatales archaeon]|nr:DUF4070 domain-containing protein [Thermoplasmatales archaeon]